MNTHRKLIVLGLNEALRQGVISLSPTDREESGHLFVQIAGHPSVVLWSSISYGELRVSVWWKYDHSQHPQANKLGNARESFKTSRPLAKSQHYPKFVGATVSAWLERKTGAFIQGRGSSGLFDTYTRRGEGAVLEALPAPLPQGFAVEGKFFA